MVLSSQSGRTGIKRTPMSSDSHRRRRGFLRPWVVVVLLGLIAGGVYLGLKLASPDTSLAQESSPAPAPTPPPQPPTLTIDPQPRSAVAPAPAPTITTTAPPPAPIIASPAPAAVNRPTATPPAPTPAIAPGMRLVETGKLVEGRAVLSAALPSAGARDAQAIRDTLTAVNQRLVFSKEIVPGDPTVAAHTVAEGDLLARIAPKYQITADLIEQINQVDARRIWVGQKLKVVQGPFHAAVDKSDFRMDVFLRDAQGQSIYVRSFPVGLGENESTPVGSFVLRKGGKLRNPAWTNPRTGEHFQADDPKNPIGEFWIALDGTTPATAELKGYGIHGTIDPQSVGNSRSMGCVRLGDDDIAAVFKLLADGSSTVVIQP